MRPGIMLCGMMSSPNDCMEDLNLKPVMTCKAKIALIRELKAGQSIDINIHIKQVQT